MSPAKAAAAAVAVALSLSACGVASKPEAGSAQAAAKSQQQQQSSSALTKHTKCLAEHRIGYRVETLHGIGVGYRAQPGNYPTIQVGSYPSGPTVEFLATPGAAQNAQITGVAQGAEVIGSALVYPYQSSTALIARVEKCMALGVKG